MEELKKGEKYQAYKFQILELLRQKLERKNDEEKALYLYQIEDKLKIPHSSLIDCLNDLKTKKWIKKLPNGRYAFFTFEPIEEGVYKIMDLLLSLWIYTNTPPSENFPETLIEIMGVQLGQDPKNGQFRSNVYGAIKRYFESLEKRRPELANLLFEKLKEKVEEIIEKTEKKSQF